jgi:hypothetical protein
VAAVEVSAIATLFPVEMVRVPTPTEAFVHDVCKRSFLSLWSYASPQGRTAGKEMCDILVLCEPDIIIFSVKEVKPKRSAPDDVRFRRWVRGAVDESVAQIYGAERFIQSDRYLHVVQESGTEGLPYPDKGVRRIHRVAVALGGDDHFPVPFGDFGKGFVHVFDERSFSIVTTALNTITDFVEYLEKKEDLFSTQTDVQFGLEEDLLAIYLHRNRSFPDADLLLVEEGVWPQFVEKPEVKAKWAADDASFIWDRLIDRIGRDVAARTMLVERSLGEDESVLRVMARENRFSRRVLGESLSSFFRASTANEVRSRMVASPSGVGYVFLAAPRDEDRGKRNEELGVRCFIARAQLKDCDPIIGIGTEQKTGAPGASWDLHFLSISDFTDEFREKASEFSKALGYFSSPRQTAVHVDEYPGLCPEE